MKPADVYIPDTSALVENPEALDQLLKPGNLVILLHKVLEELGRLPEAIVHLKRVVEIDKLLYGPGYSREERLADLKAQLSESRRRIVRVIHLYSTGQTKIHTWGVGQPSSEHGGWRETDEIRNAC